MVVMIYKEFHSPILKRTVKPDEKEYLKLYEATLIFELNFLNKQGCYCSGCHDRRECIEKDLIEIFNLKNEQKFQRN